MAIEVSIDGTAYVALSTGGGGASPWVDDGAGNVRLQDVSNDVVVGAAATAGGEKMRVVGDVRIEDPANNPMVVTDSTGGAEVVDIGNTTTNPDVRILGSGNLEVARIDRGSFINIGTVLSTSVRLSRTGFGTTVNGTLFVFQFTTFAQHAAFVEQAADPGFTGAQGKVYTKDVAGRTELFYLDDTGDVVQMTSGGSPAPGGAAGGAGGDTQVQYNNAGALAGDADFTFDGTNVTLTNALFANGGLDRSAAAALALAPTNATSVTVGALANPITAAVTIPDNTASAWLIRDAAGLGYMDITTTNAGEFVGFGNTTTAPNYFFQGASITMGVGSDASGSVEASAFGPGALFGFNRPMTVGAAVQATSITMGHGAAPLIVNSNAVTVSEADVSLGITNNAASSFLVVDPVTGNNYVDITTTTGAETVAIGGSTNPDVTLDTTGAILLGQTGGTFAVLGAAPQARAAAYTVTNPVDTRAFDTTTVTVDTLAEVVGTMIADLQGFGMFD